jgi:SAM-dependent methyltransferase
MASLLQKPVCEALNNLLYGKDHIRVLEAGCGSASQIVFAPRVHAVGIDIEANELEKNAAVQEKILGDIQDYPLPEEDFDVVICWMVLEHLSRPKDALANLFRAVKPGGIVILGFPNLASIKGLVTKFTPFWFHKLFYHLMHYQSRHFPTYLRAAILPDRLIGFAQDNGFSPAFYRLAEGGVVKKVRSRSRLADLMFSGIDCAARLVSFNNWRSALLDECAVILKKGASDGNGATSPVGRSWPNRRGFAIDHEPNYRLLLTFPSNPFSASFSL